MSTRTLTALRPDNGRDMRERVGHYFTDEDRWHYFRVALCGQEFDADNLVGTRIDKIGVCRKCEREANK